MKLEFHFIIGYIALFFGNLLFSFFYSNYEHLLCSSFFQFFALVPIYLNIKLIGVK